MIEPYYQSELVTLYYGDCLDVMPQLDAGAFDAVITDVPYGTTACAWDSPIPFVPMWTCLKRLTKRQAGVVLFGSEPFSSALRASNFDMYKYDWKWDKGRGFNPQLANVQPMKCYEDICVFSKEGHLYNPQKTPLAKASIDRRNRSSEQANRRDGSGLNIFSSPRLKNTVYTDRFPQSIIEFSPVPQTAKRHPSEKPLALMEYLIKTYTNEGDLILDFTCGSGTTLRAAKNLKRRAVGIERERHYCEVTVNRLEPAFESALVDTGASLDDLPLFAT